MSRATDEVKEEPRNHSRKIGPSMQASGARAGWGDRQGWPRAAGQVPLLEGGSVGNPAATGSGQ